jgi:hypothetical protein
MPLTLQEISDRIEIDDLLIRYSTAIDTSDWDLLDQVSFGGSKGSLAETKEFLAKAMPNFLSFQHMISNSAVELDGDTATAKTICHNPMVMDVGGGKTHVFYCGLWYCDELVRTSDGWRIRQRVEEKSYVYNQPEGFEVPA